MAIKGMRYSTAAEIEKAVRALYGKTGYSVLSQVRNGTGYAKAARTADMLVVSTWPSRGLYADGVEIKVSRSDLKSELASPEKADEIAQYCLHWWLAVPDDLLTPDMIIPPSWGVIEVSDKGKAAIKQQAKELQVVEMDTLFVCSVLRNISDSHVHVSEVAPKIAEAREAAVKDARLDREYRLKQLEEGYAAFKTHSGVDLLERGHPIWDMRSVGEAVRLIAALPGRTVEELAQAKNALTAAASALDTAMLIMGDAPSMAKEGCAAKER